EVGWDQVQDPAGLELTAGKAVEVPGPVPAERVEVRAGALRAEGRSGLFWVDRTHVWDAQLDQRRTELLGSFGRDRQQDLAALGTWLLAELVEEVEILETHRLAGWRWLPVVLPGGRAAASGPEPHHHLEGGVESIEQVSKSVRPAVSVVLRCAQESKRTGREAGDVGRFMESAWRLRRDPDRRSHSSKSTLRDAARARNARDTGASGKAMSVDSRSAS